MTCQECVRPVHAKGLCQAHYRQDLRARHANKQAIRNYEHKTMAPWRKFNELGQEICPLCSQTIDGVNK